MNDTIAKVTQNDLDLLFKDNKFEILYSVNEHKVLPVYLPPLVRTHRRVLFLFSISVLVLPGYQQGTDWTSRLDVCWPRRSLRRRRPSRSGRESPAVASLSRRSCPKIYIVALHSPREFWNGKSIIYSHSHNNARLVIYIYIYIYTN